MNPTAFPSAGGEQGPSGMGGIPIAGQWLHTDAMHHNQGQGQGQSQSHNGAAPPHHFHQQQQYHHGHQTPQGNSMPRSPHSQSSGFPPFAHLQSQYGSPPASWDMQKVLNLYIHDYCLKNNFVRAANAIAADTGVRTDEGVPMGKDAPGGLLIQWFSHFWANFTNAAEQGRSTHQQQQQQQQPHQQQQNKQGGLPSFMTSSTMRRTETEPLKKSASVSDFKGGSLRDSYMSMDDEGPSSIASFGMRSKSMTGPLMGGPDPPAGLSRAASHDVAIIMQKMGYEKQSYESLSLDEKNALIGVLKRSQYAQHQALERMAPNIPPSSMETSANRGINGTAFQQGPLSLTLPPSQQQQQSLHPSQQSPRLPSPQRPSSASTSKKSPGAPSAGWQRKKQRSSVSQQAISQLQPQAQSSQQQMGLNSQANCQVAGGPSSGGKRASAGLIPSPSIVDQTSMTQGEASRKIEEQQALARRLQLQSQGIIGQTAAPQSTPMDWNTQSSPKGSSTAHQAQSEAASFATSQVNAQIANMQNQLNRQAGSKANAQLQSNQISQLKILQNKLSQSARGPSEGEWNKQQQQENSNQTQHQHQNLNQVQTSRSNSGEMGPPPSPASASFFNQQHAMTSSASSSYPTMVDASHNSVPFAAAHSAPGTPALTTSSSISINTPDWRDTLSRSTHESPGSYMQYTHSLPSSLSVGHTTAFDSILEPSHMESLAGKSFPPPATGPVGDTIGQQRSGGTNSGSGVGGNHMTSMSHNNPFHNNFEGIGSTMTDQQGNSNLDFSNFDWNGMGTMS